jgi:glyoxylase-like metal-dependent hydrolase (beta-lactamase superfamily II)
MFFEEDMSVVSKLKRFAHSSTEVIPGLLYQVTHRGANVFVIAEEKITLIDSGLRESTSQVLEFIHHIGRTPEEVELIIITHNHIDHMGGLAEIRKHTGAKVAVHRDDIGERVHPPAADARYREPLAQIKDKLRSMFSVLREDVDIVLEGGEILDCLGGLEVIHTPGHTAGSISLYSEKYKILFTGDLIRKHRKTLMLPPRMVSFDLEKNLESIKKIASYECNILCFGHGLPLREDVGTRIRDLIERREN